MTSTCLVPDDADECQRNKTRGAKEAFSANSNILDVVGVVSMTRSGRPLASPSDNYLSR